MTSCASSPERAANATGVDVYFPAVPEPGEGDVTPVYEGGDLAAVRVSWRYWTLLLVYMADTEAAAQALHHGGGR